MSNPKYIISGGGTGGHIFPALSIAQELRSRFPDADILFVGALGKMEMERVPAAGFPIIGLPVIGMPRKASFAFISFLLKLFRSMRKAGRLIKEFKPDVAIGVGGFASGPVLKVAIRKGIPVVLQEQNSHAGVANKLLSKKVQSICVAYSGMEKFFPAEKIVLTGNPVRKNLLEPVEKKHVFETYGFTQEKPVILIIGGSLGARTLNESVLATLELIAAGDVQIIWQTGKIYYKEMLERTATFSKEFLKPVEFLTDMKSVYGISDLVISRAGAGTISELCLLGKPSVLVPSPNVAEDHQTKNAMALVEAEAAVMVKDDQAIEKLLPTALKLVKDKISLTELSANSLKLAKPNATSDIVDIIMNLTYK